MTLENGEFGGKMVQFGRTWYILVGYGYGGYGYIVRYVESKHCADQEAVKLTRVRAVKGSKRGNRRGVT